MTFHHVPEYRALDNFIFHVQAAGNMPTVPELSPRNLNGNCETV